MEYINGYDIVDFLENEFIAVDIDNKTISSIINQPIISGEANGQYFSFIMERYYSGIDLVGEGMSIRIIYKSPIGFINALKAVNVRADSKTVKFGWAVPPGACTDPGELTFLIEIDKNDGSFSWKSRQVTMEVIGEISLGDVSQEPVGEDWYTIIQNRCESLLNKVESRIDAIDNALDELEEAKQQAISDIETAVDTNLEKTQGALEELQSLLDASSSIIANTNNNSIVERHISDGSSTVISLAGTVYDNESIVVTVDGVDSEFSVEVEDATTYVILNETPEQNSIIYVSYNGYVDIYEPVIRDENYQYKSITDIFRLGDKQASYNEGEYVVATFLLTNTPSLVMDCGFTVGFGNRITYSSATVEFNGNMAVIRFPYAAVIQGLETRITISYYTEVPLT